MGYIETKNIADLLASNSNIEIEVAEACLLLFDAGGGGSEYIYLKRYSGIQLVEKTESENFKITVEFVSSRKIKITSVGLGATSVKYKVIKF